MLNEAISNVARLFSTADLQLSETDTKTRLYPRSCRRVLHVEDFQGGNSCCCYRLQNPRREEPWAVTVVVVTAFKILDVKNPAIRKQHGKSVESLDSCDKVIQK